MNFLPRSGRLYIRPYDFNSIRRPQLSHPDRPGEIMDASAGQPVVMLAEHDQIADIVRRGDRLVALFVPEAVEVDLSQRG